MESGRGLPHSKTLARAREELSNTRQRFGVRQSSAAFERPTLAGSWARGATAELRYVVAGESFAWQRVYYRHMQFLANNRT